MEGREAFCAALPTVTPAVGAGSRSRSLVATPLSTRCSPALAGDGAPGETVWSRLPLPTANEM